MKHHLRLRRLVTATLLGALAASASGCSGDDEPSATETTDGATVVVTDGPTASGPATATGTASPSQTPSPTASPTVNTAEARAAAEGAVAAYYEATWTPQGMEEWAARMRPLATDRLHQQIVLAAAGQGEGGGSGTEGHPGRGRASVRDVRVVSEPDPTQVSATVELAATVTLETDESGSGEGDWHETMRGQVNVTMVLADGTWLADAIVEDASTFEFPDDSSVYDDGHDH